MLLEDRVALVTGASRGIGAAIARAFAAEGASLVLCARGAELEEVEKELRDRGARVKAMRGDVRDADFVKQLVLACRKEHGRLDVLVNNAGILRQGLMGMTRVEDMRELFETNVVALIQLTQYAVRLMDAKRAPSIVHLASIAGTEGMEGVTAVVGFMRSSAKELAATGIRVNAIAPGFIDTDMVRGVSDDWYRRRIESIRMGRIGTPEDVAGVAVFLASNLSRYLTGQVIGVDGGMMS